MFKITTKSYGEMPISEDVAFAHLRVGNTPQDAELIRTKLEEAIAIAEDYTNRYLREQTIQVMGVTNSKGWLRMPTGSDVLSVDGSPVWEYNKYYDFVHIEKPNVELTLTAKVGFSREQFPHAIRAAVLLILGKLYEFDSDEVVGRTVGQITMSAKSILEQWRIPPYTNA